MAGLYLHIPFCTSKCFYCDFFSGNQLYLIDEYVNSLVKELKLRSSYVNKESIQTIYFGGGTPSLLTKNHLSELLYAIYDNFEVGVNCEISIECNPENINELYVNQLFDLGFNRISLGIQFLDDNILINFNRNHSKELIFKSLEIINNSHFNNLSIDLIYAVPGISDSYLLSSMNELDKFNIQHISAYSLTIANNSQLFWKIKKGEVVETKESVFISQYKIINEFLCSRGYQQYEISNYAREGFYSRHNLGYWNQVPYLGIGVSAHSYNRVSRQWNRTNIKKYISNLQDANGTVDFEIEELSENQSYNEYIILKLRTFQGISLFYIQSHFGIIIQQHFLTNLAILKDRNYFIFENDHVIPRQSDLLIADYLSKFLMI